MKSLSAIIPLLFMSSSAAHPLNTTNPQPVIPTANVTLPPGTTNHGDPNLLCTPATWFTIPTLITLRILGPHRSSLAKRLLSKLWQLPPHFFFRQLVSAGSWLVFSEA